MVVDFGQHVDGNRPHGAGLGAFAAKRAFFEIEMGQEMGRSDESGGVKLVYRPHAVTAAATAGTGTLPFGRGHVHHPIDHTVRFGLAFDLQGRFFRKAFEEALLDAFFGPLAHDQAISHGLAAAMPQGRHGHAALAVAYPKGIELVQHDFQAVRRQRHGVGVEGLFHGHVADHGRQGLGIFQCITGFVKGFEQFDKTAVPIGERVHAAGDQHHLEDAAGNGHQGVFSPVIRSGTGDGSQFKGQRVQNRLNFLESACARPWRDGRRFCR